MRKRPGARCTRLEEFLGHQEVAQPLAKDYVLLSVDTGKQENAQSVIDRVRGKDAGGGIPWMAILDGDGQQLVTSDGPKGNVGCPYEPAEIAWFRTMLERTRSKLTDGDLDALQKANEAFVETWKKARK